MLKLDISVHGIVRDYFTAFNWNFGLIINKLQKYLVDIINYKNVISNSHLSVPHYCRKISFTIFNKIKYFTSYGQKCIYNLPQKL